VLLFQESLAPAVPDPLLIATEVGLLLHWLMRAMPPRRLLLLRWLLLLLLPLAGGDSVDGQG
jgi:hypothetical protein